MKRQVIEQLNRYRFVLAPLVVLCCGGGCMVAFQPQHPVALEKIGVDHHTQLRIEGQADPRPTDAQPHAGLNGTLVIAEVAPYHTTAYPYGRGIYPIEENYDPATMFYIHASNLSPSALEQLRAMEGLSDVVPLAPVSNAHMRYGEQPMTRDTLLQAARDAGGDLLLVYTASTDADAADVTLSIGAILTLGFAPTVVVSGEAQVQAVLLDAHTGYVYALAEADGDSLGMSGALGRESKKFGEADDALEEAVGELFDRLEAAWPAMRAAYP